MRIPLAERMRPKSLDQYVGQQHIVGEKGSLRKSIDLGTIPSCIFWGQPGIGKTTLANIIAHTAKRKFISLSAINSGVKDIREAIEAAQKMKFFESKSPILFIDEIHRFSKSQQDALLSAVEKGTVTLVGATTENPSFEVISALLSRCQVYVLEPLSQEDLINLVDYALKNDEVLSKHKIIIHSYEALMRISGGDARKLFNALELVVNQFLDAETIDITDEIVTEVIQANLSIYDKSGDTHYNVISAFIKSMRSSDPNAAVYYLGRMLEGGEDPMFICRRMVIFSSEDIGLANPNALLLASTCMQSVHQIGMPEGRIIMSQTAIYLACCTKSNASYKAINEAIGLIHKFGDLPIPLHLRNAPTSLMKKLDYGKDYKYAHNFEDASTEMECMPEMLVGYRLYSPGDNTAEQKNREVLVKLWKSKYGY